MSLRNSSILCGGLAAWHSRCCWAAAAASAVVAIGVSINVAPPELPVYEQPPIPGPGYLWTPGYWAWGDEWLLLGAGHLGRAAAAGLSLDAGLLGLGRRRLLWHAGYWGPHVGFYGGVNYGFGYGGHGYRGRLLARRRRSTTTAASTIIPGTCTSPTSTTNRDRRHGNRVSFNGGNGGVRPRRRRRHSWRQSTSIISRPCGASCTRSSWRARNRQLHATINHGASGRSPRPRMPR